MAVRIRKNGDIFCAAMFTEEDGDIYIDDNAHYYLSVVIKILVTEAYERHRINGRWWWKDKVPQNINIDNFYSGSIR